jgi:hypothetical protein
MCLLHHDIRQPAKDLHIVLNIPTNSLISTAKFAETGYITVFNDKEVNVYNASNTEVIVTRQAILRGWLDKDANLYRILPYLLSSTTIPIQDTYTNHQPNFYLTARHPPKPSTTSTN